MEDRGCTLSKKKSHFDGSKDDFYVKTILNFNGFMSEYEWNYAYFFR